MGKNVVRASVCWVMGAAMQQHLDWLARSLGAADYRPLRPGDVESIRRVAEAVSVVPGGHLFREGEPAEAVYIVELGTVEVTRSSGSRRRVLATVGPGSVLGDFAMFVDRPHIADARAVEPVRAHRFARARLLPELAVNPAIMLRWLVAAMRRIERTQRRVLTLAGKPVLAQVADLILEEGQRQPSVNLSQSTIGTLLGVSRQSVNEALGRLRQLGVVETGYRNIEILNRERLEEVATTE
jgi:CRP/FNR family transcriptional regulator, cAMP and macrophage regulator